MPSNAPAAVTSQFDILRVLERSPPPGLLRRLGAAVGALLVVSVMLYFMRGGLKDNIHPDREMGFGVKGRAIADELISHDHTHAQIVVIEPDEASVSRAAAQGVHALKGDASREEENIKLLYNAGANMVVAPSISGGRLMSAAVRQRPSRPF
jgi:hypothetical protein